MSKLERFNMRDSGINPGSPSVWTSKKFAIGLLVIFIVIVMITWFGFLGWGALELMRGLTSLI